MTLSATNPLVPSTTRIAESAASALSILGPLAGAETGDVSFQRPPLDALGLHVESLAVHGQAGGLEGGDRDEILLAPLRLGAVDGGQQLLVDHLDARRLPTAGHR